MSARCGHAHLSLPGARGGVCLLPEQQAMTARTPALRHVDDGVCPSLAPFRCTLSLHHVVWHRYNFTSAVYGSQGAGSKLQLDAEHGAAPSPSDQAKAVVAFLATLA